ncbi:IS3 family transposase [Rhodococcus sp. IEGM 1366]|uniref:IS3 family transposase n=1 Tax=Rhodococcus sp. IEGM 1366 TaxID=3082223 RepID=UPI003989CE34
MISRRNFRWHSCRKIAHLPRSAFYDHRNRRRCVDRHAELKEAIRETFEDAKGAYGHRRILAILRRQGRRVSKKTVLTLMCTLGLQCLVRRRKRYNSFRGEVGEAADNVLNRQFATEFRHTEWATDLTEFNIGRRSASAPMSRPQGPPSHRL